MIVPLVVYPFNIMFSLGESDEAFQKAIIKNYPPSVLKDLEQDPEILKLGPKTNGHTQNLPTGLETIVRLKNYPKTPIDYGILAHEIFHAVSFVLFRIGIPLEMSKTDEVYAYLIDHVTKEVYLHLNKKRK